MKKSSKKNIQANAKASSGKATNVSEEDFPGYPLYPASEDIMNQAKRVDVDIEAAIENNQPIKSEVSIPGIPKLGTSDKDSDLTKDDFQALASDEIESEGDDEILSNRPWPVDFAGGDLDIPGSEQDDAQEEIGSEDEENNSYSLGGDNHEDLEEDRS
ncbi:hypothetical protein [Chryseolinea sp. H1M3-3]|uniref:hypothetical protein n=1 Tax=Chryseolinea sp. H1M3-3 TaxID=3034144 RepID=UPI0023EAB40C|nr:hypothetical protein [Chryseolinea sp. H1M3-3]